MVSVFVHVVTWNSAHFIKGCLDSILKQERAAEVGEIVISVTDNCSEDDTLQLVKEYRAALSVVKNPVNIGFAAAHNQGFKRFLDGKYDFVLILNPDVKLASNFILELIKGRLRYPEHHIFTPKLLRADQDLNIVNPPIIDAAGMILRDDLRHFDRGSEELDHGQYNKEEIVFGGTGAALFISRHAVETLTLKGTAFDSDLFNIYPVLKEGMHERVPVFDEAFFAYREDAELCWRANNMGLNTVYIPQACAYHKRVVLPDRRSQLPKLLNCYSVRNRFLMQLVNFSWIKGWRAIVPGIIIRNVVVVLAVLVRERSSIAGLRDVFKLWRRALERRSLVFKK